MQLYLQKIYFRWYLILCYYVLTPQARKWAQNYSCSPRLNPRLVEAVYIARFLFISFLILEFVSSALSILTTKRYVQLCHFFPPTSIRHVEVQSCIHPFHWEVEHLLPQKLACFIPTYHLLYQKLVCFIPTCVLCHRLYIPAPLFSSLRSVLCQISSATKCI